MLLLSIDPDHMKPIRRNDGLGQFDAIRAKGCVYYERGCVTLDKPQ